MRPTHRDHRETPPLVRAVGAGIQEDPSSRCTVARRVCRYSQPLVPQLAVLLHVRRTLVSAVDALAESPSGLSVAPVLSPAAPVALQQRALRPPGTRASVGVGRAVRRVSGR